MNLNKKISGLVLSVLCATNAYSAENFTGLSASVNLDMNGTTAYGTSTSSHTRLGDNDSNISIQSSYGLKLNEFFILGLGASFSPSEIASGEYSSSSESNTLKLKNSWTAFVTPGMVFENVLVYTKIGLAGMTGEVSTLTRSISRDWSGIVYGIGMRTYLKENIFIQIEANKFDWGSESERAVTINVKNNQASIGIGMRF